MTEIFDILLTRPVHALDFQISPEVDAKDHDLIGSIGKRIEELQQEADIVMQPAEDVNAAILNLMRRENIQTECRDLEMLLTEHDLDMMVGTYEYDPEEFNTPLFDHEMTCLMIYIGCEGQLPELKSLKEAA
ncbi:hypothetical protein [Curvivirga sp.]|uniref:hypothetical protein n=1 Tax=Curvivirga sp. TaxID=2856848 RepID=UPI003B5BCAB6